RRPSGARPRHRRADEPRAARPHPQRAHNCRDGGGQLDPEDHTKEHENPTMSDAAKTAQPTFTRPGSAVGRFFENYALVILTVAVFAFFAFLPSSSRAFPTLANLNVILGSQAVVS